MKKVLVTGGAGFVGFNLCKHLIKKDYEITVIDNFSRPNDDEDFKYVKNHKNTKFIKGDLTNEDFYDTLPKNHFDQIYHLAAVNGTGNFYKFPVKVLKVGIISMINLLDWLVKQNKGKLLFTSSSETYSGTLSVLGEENFPIPTPETVPLTIDDVSNVRWSYGGGKLLSEIALYSYRKMYELDRFSIVRLHNIYGPRMGFEHVIPQFIERILEKEFPFKIFGGEETRSFCYIDDVLESLTYIMDSDETNGEIYNVGNDDEEIRIIDLAKKLFDIANVNTDIKVLPAPEGSVSRRCPDITKLKSIGYKKQTSLEEGLKNTFEWYKNHYEWYSKKYTKGVYDNETK